MIASNLDAFRAGADAFLPACLARAICRPIRISQMQMPRPRPAPTPRSIKAAKELAIAQMADVDAVLRTADTIAETIRRARLALESRGVGEGIAQKRCWCALASNPCMPTTPR